MSLTGYYRVLEALRQRGLRAWLRRAEDSQLYLQIPLEGAAHITIGDYHASDPDNDYAVRLPEHARQLIGYNTVHFGLDGDPHFTPHRQVGTDPHQLADALRGYLRQRYRQELAQELVWLASRTLEYGAARVTGDSPAAFVLVESTGFALADDPDHPHVLIASYPGPDIGVHTDGRPVTGWHAYAHFPSAEPTCVALYDDPSDPDPEAMLPAVQAWLDLQDAAAHQRRINERRDR